MPTIKSSSSSGTLTSEESRKDIEKHNQAYIGSYMKKISTKKFDQIEAKFKSGNQSQSWTDLFMAVKGLQGSEDKIPEHDIKAGD